MLKNMWWCFAPVAELKSISSSWRLEAKRVLIDISRPARYPGEKVKFKILMTSIKKEMVTSFQKNHSFNGTSF